MHYTYYIYSGHRFFRCPEYIIGRYEKYSPNRNEVEYPFSKSNAQIIAKLSARNVGMLLGGGVLTSVTAARKWNDCGIVVAGEIDSL